LQFGATAIGVRVKDGVILGVEKKLQSAKLMVNDQRSEKLKEIDRHCACAMSGIVGDARILIDHARVEAQNHAFNFNEGMGIEQITQAVSDMAIHFGEGYEGSKQKPMARPYGVALLFGGVDERGPQLYATDPSGTYLEWKANVIGAGQETAMNELKEHYNEDMPLADAEKLVLQILKAVMEERIDKENVEVMVIPTATRKCVKRTQQQLDAVIRTLA
jgi:20S proteasome subunit alpha 5